MQEKNTPDKKTGTDTQLPETGKQGGQTDVGKKGGDISQQPGKTGGDVGQTGEVGKQGR